MKTVVPTFQATPMNLKNTADNYGAIAKWLHWGIAFLILISYISIYYEIWFTPGLPPPGETPDPAYWTALHIHLSVGITIFLLVILRIIWRISNRQPDEEPGSRLQHLAARAGHYALYAVLIITPIMGYAGTSLNAQYFFLFEIPRFELTPLFDLIVTDGLGMTFQEFEVPLDFIHKVVLGRWLVWILILGHVLAALYHHFIRKDRTLYKMTTNGDHPTSAGIDSRKDSSVEIVEPKRFEEPAGEVNSISNP